MEDFATRGDQRLRYRLDGRDGAPVLVLANSLGTTLDMWEPQMDAFARRFRVLRFDARGHGGSSVPAGPATIEDLGRDALAVMDAAGVGVGAGRVAFCGLSVGGATGLWLARNHPDRIARLVVANSAPSFPPARLWDDRIDLVAREGVGAVADGVLARWLTPGFAAAGGAAPRRLREIFLGNEPRGYAACCAAVRDADLGDALAGIRCPTLFVAGLRDQATPPERSRAMAAAVPGARLVELDAAHLSNWERPEEFAAAVLGFLVEGGTLDERDRREIGMSLRRRVLGDAWVDRAQARTGAFGAPFQDLITRYAWGEVWARPGLDPATRSCMVLSTMIALGRWEEFRLHVRAAFNNGLGEAEIQEVILQAAVYCGVPAANTAVHHAEAVFAEMAAETGGNIG
jgi:3-oxoadipate enol-lactonase/4-carboxymuconolactone decarboxylase